MPIGSVVAGYAIERKVGEGGMADVYAAQDQRRGRHVALKVLKREIAGQVARERFLREIAVTSGLDHPNIVALFDSGEIEGLPFYTMPLVEGESLRAMLDRHVSIPPAEALRIIRNVAEALEYAANRGVIHRDVKPENILMSSGQARVADFGIAAALRASQDARLTTVGFAVGTVAYMSPEQAEGGRIDARSDLFSLAAISYEMLAGEPMYAGATPHGALLQRWKQPKIKSSRTGGRLSPAVCKVLEKALAPDPNARYATATEFANALEVALATPDSRFPRSMQIAASIALGAVALIIVTVVATRRVAAERGPARVAVLPLTAVAAGPKDDYIVPGIHQSIISELSQIPSLGVIARSSVMPYANGNKPAPIIARELNVAAIVSGSVAFRGDSIDISMDLVDPRTQTNRWSHRFSGTRSDIVALARQVAVGVEGAMGITAAPEQAAARHPTPNRTALDAYLRAQFRINRGAVQDIAPARAYLDEAVAADSTFAEPHAVLAGIHINSAFLGVPPKAAFDSAIGEARRAIALDSNSAAAHMYLGYAMTAYEWNWKGAEVEFTKAIALNPNLVDARWFYSLFLAYVGRTSESVDQARRAVELDPISPYALLSMGRALYWAGQYDEAAAKADEVLKLAPDFVLAYDLRALIRERQGRREDAVADARKVAALAGGDADRRAAVAYFQARAGHNAEAKAGLDSLLAEGSGGHISPATIAPIYLALGDREAALRWLAQAYREHDMRLGILRVSPMWIPLHDDPRYQALIKDIGLSPVQ